MTSAARSRLSIALFEQLAVGVDGGFGMLAVAAIAARAPGPARELEAVVWARKAAARSDYVATVFRPGMTDDEVEATTLFMCALEMERRAAAA